jgi:hypothetical protein
MYTLLQPEQLYTFCLYFVFKNLPITNENILVPKIEALQMGPETENGDFLENSSNTFDYISVLSGGHLPQIKMRMWS